MEILAGATIELAIFTEPIPPVSLAIAHPTPRELAVAAGEKLRATDLI